MCQNILIVNTNQPVCSFRCLEEVGLWDVRHTNINKAQRVLNNKYIDLICLELNNSKDDVWKFLTDIKKQRLRTKILSIIPDNRHLKEKVLSYGSDDYLCKPYGYDDLLLRCKKLTDQISIKYESLCESQFIKYDPKFNIVRCGDTYLPLTPKQILLIKLLLENKYLNRKEISKYFTAKFEHKYSENYISVLIYRTRKKIELCTGMNLIRNNYGLGYYLL